MSFFQTGDAQSYLKNRKTYIDGILFDSKREANRYLDLKILEKGGEIWDLQLQPKFELQPKFKIPDETKKQGFKTVSAITYTADFQYKTRFRGFEVEVVEDVKGHKTQAYQLRKRMFLYHHVFLKHGKYLFKET